MIKKIEPTRASISEALKKYKEENPQVQVTGENNQVIQTQLPKYNASDFEATMSRETDPDLMTSFEIVKLPSNGLFYANKVSEVLVEYMTSKDEDLLTTPSLIDSGKVIDMLLKRKIKTNGINVDELLNGDRNAIILFLRTSSYGSDYTVQVYDPRTNIPFTETINLLKLNYKVISEEPDEFGHFTVFIPMRKKTVKLRLLTHGEDMILFNKAEQIKEVYNEEFSQYSTMKLKASIVSIDEKTDRSYIDRFVDAMPALDAITIRRKLLAVMPDVDMNYEFTAKDGYKFKTNLSIGVDFFFPNN